MFARFHTRLQILGRQRALLGGHGLSAVALALAGSVLLGGCGQKGPLFFAPPPKTSPVPANPRPAVAPANPANPGAPAVIETPDIPQPPPAAPPSFYTPR